MRHRPVIFLAGFLFLHGDLRASVADARGAQPALARRANAPGAIPMDRLNAALNALADW